MTLTKEWLQQTIAELEEERDAIPGAVNEDAAMALAAMKMALASMTAEPVAWQWEYRDKNHVTNDQARAKFVAQDGDVTVQPLFTAPPEPVVPDEMKELLRLVECMLADYRENNFGHASEWIRHISSASDSFENEHFLSPWLWAINPCRAAMLQGAEPVSQRDELPANVIDALEKALQAMSFMGDTLNALDAVCEEDVEYVTPAFEAVRQVLEGNSPAIPDGWVARSERMPAIGVPVITYCGDVVQYAVYAWDGKEWQDWYEEYDKLPSDTFTHWHPLPAAPQQEAE